MIIILGLGNPGEEFHHTRHNVGFMAVDTFAKDKGFPDFSLEKKFQALISEGTLAKEKVLLVKPETFMNNSGKAAKAVVKYAPKKKTMVVVHDDADLPLGKMKVVVERGSAGHKGVESIIRAIGNRGLIRLRIGIGDKKDTAAQKMVLKKFTPAEQTVISKVIKKAAAGLDTLIHKGIEKTMNEFNQ